VRQILALLSCEAEARRPPSGEKQTPRTLREWPLSVRRHSPVAADQRRRELSWLQEAIVTPSELQVTPRQQPVWP